jgi:hypothetical protein
MQHVRGHDLAIQVDLVEYHCCHRHLVRLHADLGLSRDHSLRFEELTPARPGPSGCGIQAGTLEDVARTVLGGTRIPAPASSPLMR